MDTNLGISKNIFASSILRNRMLIPSGFSNICMLLDGILIENMKIMRRKQNVLIIFNRR